MAGDTIGVGVIGPGWMGRTHTHALHTINHMAPLPKRIRLVHVAGRRPEPTERFARAMGFERWTTDWRELVDDPEVEVVANLTVNRLHAAPTIAALQLGKPVLCEKPLGEDEAEGRAMLDAARAAGVTSATGFNYRYVPAVRLLREIVQDGRIGSITHYRGLYLQDWGVGVTQAQHLEHGSAGNYAHLIDMLRHILGDPLSVTAEQLTIPRAETPPHGLGEDAYAAVFRMPNGIMATLEASRLASGWKGRQRVELNGSAGSVWWDMEDLNRLHVFFRADEAEGLGGFRDVMVTQKEHPFMRMWWEPGHIIGWEHTFAHQWLDFLGAVLEGRPVPPEQASFEDGYRANVIADGILASARDGRRVDLAAAPT